MSKKQTYRLTFLIVLSVALALTQATNASEKGSMKGSSKGSMHEGHDHEHKGSGHGKMDPAMAEMMQKWQEYSTPNENHKVLGQLTGDWDHSLKMWMDPNTPPEVSTGTSSIRWIMDGRFIQHEVEGVSMGQPFSGIAITGYDNLKQKYVSIWLDNMGTGMMAGEGHYDPESNTLTDTGTYSCPLKSGARTYRAVTTFINEDNFIYEMYTTDFEGNEYRSMEIKYTRS